VKGEDATTTSVEVALIWNLSLAVLIAFNKLNTPQNHGQPPNQELSLT